MPAGVAWRTERRHRVGLATTEARLRRLLQEFRFDRMDLAFVDDIGLPAAGPAEVSAEPQASRLPAPARGSGLTDAGP